MRGYMHQKNTSNGVLLIVRIEEDDARGGLHAGAVPMWKAPCCWARGKRTKSVRA